MSVSRIFSPTLLLGMTWGQYTYTFFAVIVNAIGRILTRYLRPIHTSVESSADGYIAAERYKISYLCVVAVHCRINRLLHLV